MNPLIYKPWVREPRGEGRNPRQDLISLPVKHAAIEPHHTALVHVIDLAQRLPSDANPFAESRQVRTVQAGCHRNPVLVSEHISNHHFLHLLSTEYDNRRLEP